MVHVWSLTAWKMQTKMAKNKWVLHFTSGFPVLSWCIIFDCSLETLWEWRMYLCVDRTGNKPVIKWAKCNHITVMHLAACDVWLMDAGRQVRSNDLDPHGGQILSWKMKIFMEAFILRAIVFSVFRFGWYKIYQNFSPKRRSTASSTVRRSARANERFPAAFSRYR